MTPTKPSEALEIPSALLRRLYEIEEVQNPMGGTADQGDRPGLEETLDFLKEIETAGDGESFPARMAWELQSQLWPQQDVKVIFALIPGVLG